MKKNGFTLVELSIVLVIIGLLIGGILVGQTLVDATRITSTIKKLAEFDAAVYSFQDRFKSLPGDSKVFGGNGNGFIAANTGNCNSWQNYYCHNSFGGEIANFWRDLSYSGIMNDLGSSFIGGATSMIASGALQNVATLPIGKDCIAYVHTYMDNTGGSAPEVVYGKHFYAIINVNSQLGVPSGNHGCMLPIEALSIDKKLDNGLHGSGIVRRNGLGGIGEVSERTGGANPQTGACVSGTGYNVSNTSLTCSLGILMDISK